MVLICVLAKSYTLPIALTRLLKQISTIHSVRKVLTHMTTMLRVYSLSYLKVKVISVYPEINVVCQYLIREKMKTKRNKLL